MGKGKVALVGAGPGNPGLLTVRGRQLLEQADVVVYDRLICDDVLDHAPKAKKIYVGKERGNHSVPQEEINEILVREAGEHSLVVRLKGGDPYLFGRGGEEAQVLRQNGIPFEVVPGITSALAALAYTGIPVTHREAASSVHIITGHAKAGELPEIDFAALYRTKGTLVFLMAVSTMEFITTGLLDAGMPADTPAAVVENGTLPTQRKVTAPLGHMAEAAQQADVQSPAILAVGGVCALEEELDWFSHRPLFGRTVVVTRPARRGGTLGDRLRELGAQVISFPCIETTPANLPQVCDVLERLASYGWLVLTSPQGVESLFQALDQLGKDVRLLAPVKIAVIGTGTAKALEARGLRADYMPEQYDGVHLAKGLIPHIQPGERLLLLRAQAGTPEVTKILEQSSIDFDDIPCYTTQTLCPENREETEALLRKGKVDWVTFTSASTVEGFAACIPQADRYPFTAACIGASSQKAAGEKGYAAIQAQNATIDYLLAAILEEESHE